MIVVAKQILYKTIDETITVDNQYAGENNATIITVDFSDSGVDGYAKWIDLRLEDGTGAPVLLGIDEIVNYTLPVEFMQRGRLEIQPYAISDEGDRVKFDIRAIKIERSLGVELDDVVYDPTTLSELQDAMSEMVILVDEVYNAYVSGELQGEQGIQGVQGETGITGASIIDAGFVADNIVFTKDDATTVVLLDAKLELKGDQGVQGIQGIQGIQGLTGASITSATFDNDDIVFTKDDLTTVTLADAKIELKGDKGDTGNNFTILGSYDTLIDLETAHPTGEVGDAWAVGLVGEQDIYLWDTNLLEWVDIGSLSPVEDISELTDTTDILGNRTYTEKNFVTDLESLTDSVDALDIAIGNIELTADNVSIDDVGDYYTSTDVEGALQEIGEALDNLSAEASAISIEDTGEYYTSDNVEGALQEIGLDIIKAEDELLSQPIPRDADTLEGNSLDEVQNYLEATETITVGTGGQFTTINEALAFATKKYPVYVSATVLPRVTINLLTGFEMAEQVIGDGQDLSWITISSVDAEVTIVRSALTVANADSRFATFTAQNGGFTPIINVLFNMDTSGTATDRDGLEAFNNSRAIILSGKGFKNCATVGLYANLNAIVNAEGANASGAGNRGVWARESSIINAKSVNASNSSLNCIESDGSYINARDAIATGAGNFGLSALRGGTINGQDANAQKGGSPSTTDIRVALGGIINAGSSTGGISQTANTLTSAGIIFK